MKLDVGCGADPHGDVNVDVTRNVASNFIRASGEYLPFLADTFTNVFCFHVIEHVNRPTQLLRELRRVCVNNGEIKITCPHRYSRNAKHASHRCYFNLRWFQKHVQAKKVRFTLTHKQRFPFLGLIMLPHEITVHVEQN
jgi:ubiquinone/menaquinone biosynthesis C-methylase UbiE